MLSIVQKIIETTATAIDIMWAKKWRETVAELRLGIRNNKKFLLF